MKISIIIPLFNEQESVFPLYQSIIKVMNPSGLSYEVIFVDDGSDDETFERSKVLASNDKNLRVLKFRRNYGQTAAMVAGFDHAKGDILITMDGDMQNDPADIPYFIQKIQEGYDIVIGWRYKRHDNLITRKIPSKIANWMIGKITGVPIKDNGCSLKAYRSKIIKHIPLYSEMHRFLPAMSSIVGIKIYETKVKHHPRKFGKSKYGLSRIYKVLLDVVSIKSIIAFSNRPLVMFGIPALFAAVLSFIFILLAGLRFVAGAGESVVTLLGLSFLLGSLASFMTFVGILCELIYRTGNLKIEKLSLLTQKK